MASTRTAGRPRYAASCGTHEAVRGALEPPAVKDHALAPAELEAAAAVTLLEGHVARSTVGRRVSAVIGRLMRAQSEA